MEETEKVACCSLKYILFLFLNTWSYLVYLLFLYLGTIWLSSCRRYTEVGHLERGGSSYHREETSCNRQSERLLNPTFSMSKSWFWISIIQDLLAWSWISKNANTVFQYFVSTLTWQNSPHPAVSSCYSFEGLGLADLQTLGFHKRAVSASFVSFLHQQPCRLHLLGPWRAHPPAPGSGQPTRSKSSHW